MSGIYGWIADKTNRRQYKIIRRSSEIDALLNDSGIDPSSVNRAVTPLVGASEYGHIQVLIMQSPDAGAAPFRVPQADDLTTVWEMFLSEPGAFAGGTAQYQTIPGNVIPSGFVTTPLFKPFDWTPLGEYGEGQSTQLAANETSGPSRINALENIGNQPQEIARGSTDLGQAQPLGANDELVAIPEGANIQPRIRSIASFAGSSSAGGGGDGGGGPDIGTGTDTGTQDKPGGPGGKTIAALNDTPGRFAHWDNLIPVSIRELRRSAASASSVAPNGRPRLNDSALFVVDFVDARYALQSIGGSYSYTNVSGNDELSGKMRRKNDSQVVGGMERASCFNMIADEPIRLEPSTCSSTVVYPRAVGTPWSGIFTTDADLSGTISRKDFSILAASPTSLQVPFTFDQIIEQMSLTVSAMTLGRVTLSYDSFQTSISQSQIALTDDGDLIDLDFRGLSIAQRLDLLAQRLGCVWIWDRSASCLILQLATVDSVKFAVPNYSEWMKDVETHRVSGYINSLTLDIARTVIVSHEARYCSAIGPVAMVYDSTIGQYGQGHTLQLGADLSPEYNTWWFAVDSRSAEVDGSFISTINPNALNVRTPLVWHTYSPNPTHLSVEIHDHIPALIGTYYPPSESVFDLPGSPFDTAYGKNSKGLGETGGRPAESSAYQTQQPWNYQNRTFPGVLRGFSAQQNVYNYNGRWPYGWGTIPENLLLSDGSDSYLHYKITLEKRKQIHEERMARLMGVIDGDLTLNRLPPVSWDGRERSHTPSVGLQYEEISFGADDGNAIRYRIHGKNTHPLLYPHGTRVHEITGGNGITARPQNRGTRITMRRNIATGIKRTFLCRFEPLEQAIGNTNSRTETGDLIWLYRFIEVTPDASPASMIFHEMDFLGWSRAEGYALNICEMHYRCEKDESFVPSQLWDGTVANFKQQTGNTYNDMTKPTAPAGYGICYEVYLRTGFTAYYIYAPNGVEVTCGGPVNPFAPPAQWPYMGISGVATATDMRIVSDIMGA